MHGELTIRQNRLGHRRAFRFADDGLLYTLRDPSGAERTFSVPYQAVDLRSVSSVRSKNLLFVRKLARLAAVGLLAGLAAAAVDRPIGAIIAAVAALAWAAVWAADAAGLLVVSFTNAPMTPPPPGSNSGLLSIIDDDNRDRILDELAQRWRQRVRALFGAVDPDGEPHKEAARMRWLRVRGIISEREFAEQIGRLRARANAARAPEAA